MSEDDYDIVAEAEAILAEDDSGLSMVDTDEIVRGARQLQDRLDRPLTEEDVWIVAKEINALRVSSIILELWERGHSFMGDIVNGEIVWYSDEG